MILLKSHLPLNPFNKVLKLFKVISFGILLFLLPQSIIAQNNYLHFDGVDDYVDLGTLNPTGNFTTGFTYMGWVKWDEIKHNSRIFDFGNGEALANILLATTSSGQFYFHSYKESGGSDFAFTTTVSAITTNKWHHIAATITNTGVATIYLDGVAIGSANSGVAPANIARTKCYLGKSNWVNPIPNASMDEVSIWSKALTQTDIHNYMFTPLVGNEGGLYAYYKFNQGTAGGTNTGITELTDATINTKHGTLLNFALTGSTSNWVERVYKPEPTYHATNFTAQMDAANIKLTWTDAIGSCLPDGYLIAASITDAFTNPTNGIEPTLDADLSDGTAIIKVPQGSQNYSGFTNAVNGTTYYFRIYPYSNAGPNIIYKTDGVIPQTQITKPVPQFEELAGTPFQTVFSGSSAWGDYDNDGDLDLLLTGTVDGGNVNFSIIYQNNSGVFTDIGAGLTGVRNGAAAWGDYDNDGDLDIVLVGIPHNSGYISKVYQNNSGVFTDIGISMAAVGYGDVAWGDYDNDGFLDILLSGSAAGLVASTKVYHNNGDGTFTEATSIKLAGVYESSVDWGDYDNDGFLDILLVGIENFSSISKIYRNNGDGSFTEQTSISLYGVHSGSAIWGDYDNDGFLDILLTGDYHNPKALVYRNTGNGNFSLQPDISLKGVFYGESTWSDFDNDGDLDILITGRTDGNTSTVAIMYRNDSGIFTQIDEELVGIPGVSASSVVWGDYDNDGDLDLFMTGYDRFSNPISKLFVNNFSVPNNPPQTPQNLNYTINNENVNLYWDKVTTDETPVNGITYNLKIGQTLNGNELKPSQSNHDGYRAITARGNMQYDTSFTFNNFRWDSTYYAAIQAIDQGFAGSVFTHASPLCINAIQLSNLRGTLVNNTSIALNWDRGNGDKCILFAKANADTTHYPLPKDSITYYFNNQFGEGSPIGTSGWYCIYKGVANSVLLTELDPAKSYKVVGYEFQNTRGYDFYESTHNETNVLYTGTLPFSENTTITIDGISGGNVAWGDYDNDGYLDILLTGSGISIIFRNDAGVFKDINAELIQLSSGSSAWGDYDNDGDLDLLLTGLNYSNRISKIYRNDEGEFTDIGADLVGVSNSSVAWGDYDNDGDLDLVLSGQTESGRASKIYRNDAGVFTDINAGLIGVSYGSVAWGDYNNDGFLDLLLTGMSYDGTYNYSTSIVYQNNGDGTFSEQSFPILGVYESSVAWGDFDNDGFLDVLITGNYGGTPTTKLYHNNGASSIGFTEQTNIALTNVNRSSVAWGDYDNDGDLDILLTGSGISIIYRNDSGKFTEINSGLIGVNYSSVAWGDYDNDGDLDFLLTGNSASGIISKVYNNNLYIHSNITSNTKPEKPIGLYSILSPDKVELCWTPSSDQETNSSALTYNLRYKSADSTQWLFAPQTVDTTAHGMGKRLLPTMGNVQQNKSFSIKNLLAGTYQWQVQAIDQGFLGSEWSELNTFEVKTLQAFFTFDTVCVGNATKLVDLSTSTQLIATRQWKYFNTNTQNFEVLASDSLASSIFPNAGIDSIMLVVMDIEGLKDSVMHTITIKPGPKASFIAPAVCMGSTTTFTNNSTIPLGLAATWKWDFGDNRTTTQIDPDPHGYLNAGIYNVVLKINTSNGCSDSTNVETIVAAIPNTTLTLDYGSPTFCQGDSVQYSVQYNENFSYLWTLYGDKIPEFANTLKVKNTSGNYRVEVTNNLANCWAQSDVKTITMNESPGNPAISYNESTTTFCAGESITLITNVVADSYTWLRGTAEYATGSNSLVATESGNYSLRIGKIYANYVNCYATSTDVVSVTRNPLPTLTSFSHGETNVCSGTSVNFTASSSSSPYFQWFRNNEAIENATSNSFSATQSGSYKIQLTNTTNSCNIFSQTVQVTINELPSKPLISEANNNTLFCFGTEVELLVTNEVPELNYHWKRSGIAIEGATTSKYSGKLIAGDYRVEAKAGGCANESDILTLTTKPAPAKPEIFARGPNVWILGCSNETATAYRWFYNDALIPGANTHTYVANQQLGNYYVVVNEGGECWTATDVINIPTGTIVGIDNNLNPREVVVFPNPSAGIFNVNLGATLPGKTTVRVTDALGRLVLTQEHSNVAGFTVDLSNTPKGVYFCRIEFEGIRVLRRLVVE